MAEWAPEWRFAEMTPAQMAENPVQGEFFTSAADMPERLVREAIQNSMDAALDNEVVRVRFAFSGIDHALQSRQARQYLDGLTPHLDAVADAQTGTSAQTAVNEETQAVYRASRLLDEPLEYLVVEDFGTRGLTGDIYANGASELGNDFWGFFRQIGISTKGEDAAGSWGLGKWVFPDASQINSFLALTRRAGEDDGLLMGLAILKTHELNGCRYPAYGHFAAADEADDRDWFQMPAAESDLPVFVREAANNFQLWRAHKSGVSVIILWPKDELTPASLARSVITQYFLPIMRGKLEVVIQHPEEEDRVINADQIADELEWIDESDRDDESEHSLRGLLELAKWGDQQDDDDGHIQIDLPSRTSNPLRDEKSALDIGDLRDRYQRGEQLAFKLWTEIKQQHDYAATEVACRVYLQRAEDLDHGHDYFVRGNLRVQKIDHLRSQQARSLLLVDGESLLGHLLRDAEGPAHTEWDPRAAKVKERWALGAGARIDDVRRAPLRLIQALVERPAERQLDALADLFPADGAAPPSRSAAQDRSGGGQTTDDHPPPPTNPSPVRLSQIMGGFRVQARTGADVVGSTWRVRFAYELARGGKSVAFRQFERGVKDDCPDFSLYDAIKIERRGCYSDVAAHNEFTFEVRNHDFRLSVTGFDERDVLVELEPAPTDDMDDEEGDAA